MAWNPGHVRMLSTSRWAVAVWLLVKVPLVGSHGSFDTASTRENMTPQPDPSGASEPLSTRTPS